MSYHIPKKTIGCDKHGVFGAPCVRCAIENDGKITKKANKEFGREVRKEFVQLMYAIILSVILLGGITLFVAITGKPQHSQKSAASSTSIVLPPTANEVEAQINIFRTSKGLAPFNSEVASLDQAAQARAEGMCATNDWSHAQDWAVLGQYYSYSYAGENLYYGSLQTNQAKQAVINWSESPSHLKNLMTDYAEIGVGVKACPGFQNEPTAVIVTNYFGVPR